MGEARATRFLFALIGVAFVSLMTPTDARAQFVCNPAAPTPGDSVICTLTGTVAAFPNTTTLNGNSTINVTPTGIASSTFATTDDGNALVQNQGLIGLMNATSLGIGNATAINLFGGNAGIMQTTSQSGVATSQNAGTVQIGIETVSQNIGTAISNNSGFTDYISTTTPNGGTATTFNSGTVFNVTGVPVNVPGLSVTSAGIFTSTMGGSGDATTTNTGNIFGNAPGTAGLLTLTDTGNAKTTNSGTIYGDSTTIAFVGGAAATNNSGYVGGVIANSTQVGTATVVNSGTVANTQFPAFFAGITNYSLGGGDATTINTSTGVVSGGIATAAAIYNGAGNATTINAGTTDFMSTYVGNSFVPGSNNALSINTGTLTDPLGNGPAIFILGGGYTSAMLTMSDSGGSAVAINYGKIASDPNNPSMLTISNTGDATTINYGTTGGIQTLSGSFGIGIGNAAIFNYGTASTGISAIAGGDGNASVYNAGRSFGGLSAQAYGFGSATITNSGFVDGTSTNGVAITLEQPSLFTSTTLNILPGSRIIGFINLNGPGFAPFGTQINIFGGQDISSTLTFGSGCGCFNNITDTGSVVNVFGGAPFVISKDGNTVSVLDPTSFAVQDKNIADFSHTISSMVTSRLNNPASMSGGSTPIGFAPSGNVAVDMTRDAFAGISSLNYASTDRVLFSNPSMTAADGTSVWAQGFVGQRIQDADAPTLRSINNFYGGMMGADKSFRPSLRLGALLGAGAINSTVDLNSGDTKSDIVFGGLYGRYAMNQTFVDFALLGGHSNNNLHRNMANNFAPGGLETATASYDGWFISPEIAYGVKMPIASDLTLTPTGRVRYLAAGFGGYQESGSTTNLTVASRTSHNFEERGEVTLTKTSDPTPSQRMQISGTLGLLSLQRVGDTTVNTILLGQNLPFATPGKNDIFGGYGGVGFDWRHISGWTIFGAAEYTATNDSSHTATAKGGVKVAF